MDHLLHPSPILLRASIPSNKNLIPMRCSQSVVLYGKLTPMARVSLRSGSHSASDLYIGPGSAWSHTPDYTLT